MPELLVYIRARDAEDTVGEALEAVLLQKQVEFCVSVVDDASRDRTAAIVESFADPRVDLLRTERPLGEGGCGNLALGRSGAPFVAAVEPRGIVLPGAFRALLDACSGSPEVGLAHCYFFDADPAGGVRRDLYRAQRELFKERLAPDGEFRKRLLLHGNLVGPLRLFRREAFEVAVAAARRARPHHDYEAVLTIADRWEIAVVPEYLYCRKAVEPEPQGSELGPVAWAARMTDLVQQALACRRALAGRRGRISTGGNDVRGLVLRGLYERSGLASLARSPGVLGHLSGRLWRRGRGAFRDWLYYGAAAHLAALAGGILPGSRRPSARRRVAYYTWHFPILSQTFVNRELAALGRAGVQAEVIAEAGEDLHLADHDAVRLVEHTTYTHPVDPAALASYRRHFRRRKPLTYFRLTLFFILCRYSREKTLAGDLLRLSKAVYLAGILRDKGITHVHSPWADGSALVALGAARLLGISYSVQARAHDLHRHTFKYALREKLRAAEFVVTNTDYNEAVIRSIVGPAYERRIHVINNGLDLERFVPGGPRARGDGAARVLSVARLIEPKGLIHLLAACGELAERGVDFTCEIVGGPEEPLYTKYHLELKRRHRRLALGGRVRFLGTMPFLEVLERYHDADIFVLPCVVAADGTRDITPNAVIEAMAMGLPVISTTVGGVPELVEDGVSGLLVEPGNAEALADALERLIRDPELRAELGRNARRRAETKFDVNRNITRYVSLFEAAR